MISSRGHFARRRFGGGLLNRGSHTNPAGLGVQQRWRGKIWALVDGSRADTRRDIVNPSRIWTPSGGASWGTEGWACHSGFDRVQSSNDAPLLNRDVQTFVLRYRPRLLSAPDAFEYFVYRPPVSTLWLHYHTGEERFQSIGWSGGGGDANALNVAESIVHARGMHTLVWRVRRNSSAHDLWLDGIFLGAFPASTGDTSYASSNELAFGGRSDADDRNSDAIVQSFAAFGCWLTDYEAAEMSGDFSGAIFEPVVPLFFVPPLFNVVTADGLLTTTTEVIGSSEIAVSTVGGLLESSTTLLGDVFLVSNVTTVDGLLSTATALLGSYTVVGNVVTADGLLESTTEIIGSSEIAVSTADGLLETATTLLGSYALVGNVTTSDGLLTAQTELIGTSSLSIETVDGLLTSTVNLLGEVSTGLRTSDGLLDVSTVQLGDYVITAETSDGLLTTVTSLEGGISTGVITADGLLTTVTELLGDPAVVAVETADGLLATTTTLLGSASGVVSIITDDGLLSALTELRGFDTGIPASSVVGLESTSIFWSTESTTIQYTV